MSYEYFKKHRLSHKNKTPGWSPKKIDVPDRVTKFAKRHRKNSKLPYKDVPTIYDIYIGLILSGAHEGDWIAYVGKSTGPTKVVMIPDMVSKQVKTEKEFYRSKDQKYLEKDILQAMMLRGLKHVKSNLK